jgi:hypothetical protein
MRQVPLTTSLVCLQWDGTYAPNGVSHGCSMFRVAHEVLHCGSFQYYIVVLFSLPHLSMDNLTLPC